MTTTVHTSLIVLILSFLSFNALAASENDVDRAEQIEQRLNDIKQRLKLSDEQAEQIKPIFKAGFEARSAVLEKYGIDPEEGKKPAKKLGLRKARKMKKEMDKVRSDTLSQLSGVLSKQQLEEYQQIQQESKAALREKIQARR